MLPTVSGRADGEQLDGFIMMIEDDPPEDLETRDYIHSVEGGTAGQYGDSRTTIVTDGSNNGDRESKARDD
jgi:hypothetical protein